MSIKRDNVLKIFGLGLSRTGTTSLTSALTDVGFRIVHYPQNKKQLFSTANDGATDIPVIYYYKELDQAFPNSKFIYTTRDRDDWVNSMSRYLPRKKTWKTNDWTIQHRVSAYGRADFDRADFTARFDEYDVEIREYFKGREQDLLVLNIFNNPTVKDLYKFLGVTGRDSSILFPHKNKLKS